MGLYTLLIHLSIHPSTKFLSREQTLDMFQGKMTKFVNSLDVSYKRKKGEVRDETKIFDLSTWQNGHATY